jgi:hypothetical protein
MWTSGKKGQKSRYFHQYYQYNKIACSVNTTKKTYGVHYQYYKHNIVCSVSTGNKTYGVHCQYCQHNLQRAYSVLQTQNVAWDAKLIGE